MSLEKEDLRTKHDPEIMHCLREIAAFNGMEVGKQAALLIEKIVMGEWHMVNLAIGRVKRYERMRADLGEFGQGSNSFYSDNKKARVQTSGLSCSQ
ncbi:hypothetical protein [Acinetobacter sp. HY1485]|uniref:hypothetical protein n=1 Tax=Acinetobacter sp. HY1485 TaxID=2970918 RepID=UPI0022B97672|nr:hypothetical protein [Acinetobacter sp. HY1485]